MFYNMFLHCILCYKTYFDSGVARTGEPRSVVKRARGDSGRTSNQCSGSVLRVVRPEASDILVQENAADEVRFIIIQKS